MVCYNSGLPEPPSQEEAVSTNGEIIILNESESDDDANEYDGYEPLSMNPDNEYEDDSEGGENEGADDSNGLEPIVRAENILVREVWSSNENVVNITMDKEKEDMVKQAMVNFTLPPSAIPDWAVNIPEEQWKEHLMRRLENLKQNE